jgi:hypothetical protein
MVRDPIMDSARVLDVTDRRAVLVPHFGDLRRRGAITR